MIPLVLVACAQWLAAPGELTLDFEVASPAVELHNGAQIVADGDGHVLRLDARKEQYATLTPGGDISGDGIRLEARVKLAKHAAGGYPVGRQRTASLYIDGGGKPWLIFWTGGKRRIINDERSLSLGEWHHIAADYRVGGYVEFTVDGRVVLRAPAPGPLDDSDAQWLVGRWDWTEDGEEKHAYTAADIDDLRIGPPEGKLRSPDDPGPRLIEHFSWGDMILSGEVDTREKIRQTLQGAKDRGVEKVQWRLSAAILREDCRRAPEDKQAAYIKKYHAIVDRVFAEMDPIAEAIRIGHELGLQMYGWLTIYDEGAPPDVLYADGVPFPWQSKFTIAHPEYIVVDREGKQQWGVLEYAYPKARRYKAKQIAKYLRRYDLDGVFISTRSHSQPAMQGDRFGFNKPIVKAYKERFGKDILTEDFDREAWRRLRGEYLTQLLREIRAAVPKRQRICLGVPRGDHIGPPYGNMFLDWRTWVGEKLVDELVLGELTGKGLYPQRKDYEAYVFDQEAGVGLRPVREDIEKRYGPLCREHGVELYVQARPESLWVWQLLKLGLDGVRF